MRKLTPALKYRWFAIIACLLLCVVGLVFILRPTAPVPVTVLRQPYRSPELLRDRLYRWVPATPSWAWLWRFQEVVFGRRKPINVYADIFTLPDSSRPILSGLSLGRPTFSSTNGLQVWLLAAPDLKILRGTIEKRSGTARLYRPRISTADGIGASLFQGQAIALNGFTNDVGFAGKFFPRVRHDSTDLMAIFNVSEVVTNEPIASNGLAQTTPVSIQTNLHLAVRLQIPNGSGVFLLNTSLGEENRKLIGIIIDAP